MLAFRAKLCVSLILGLAVATACASRDESLEDRNSWVVEQMPGGRVEFSETGMQIRDKGGCTVWFKQPLQAPVRISYTAMLRSSGRVSDLNCFWMATDPTHPENLFYSGHKRTGAFATYDGLATYYVGYGGNTNTTTRFRRYDGSGARPLQADHDLRSSDVLLEPEKAYAIDIEVRDGRTTYAVNGRVLFDFPDKQMFSRGWFGFRTVDSHIDVLDFKITPLGSDQVTDR